jgi:hypothetical protein
MNNVEYARRDAFKLQLLKAAEAGQKVYENTINKLNNCAYARTLENKYTIKEIFSRYWEEFCGRNSHKLIRPSITMNVERMIACHDLSKGYIFYECPTCENFHISGLSCHSRFCPTCGKVYRERRANEIAKKCLNVPHRQFVFSIAKELRNYFRNYRDLYDELFHAVNDVFEYLIQGKSKIAQKEDRELGYMMFLHTFGRDLKHNPHIHVLIAERVIDKDLLVKRFEYFDFEVLRKAFMNQLLKRFYQYLKVHTSKNELIEFSKLRNRLYRVYPSGFYTHGPKLKNNSRISIKNVTKYIARYAGHPAIAESRITNVDYDNHTITYYYDPHEDDNNEVIEEKLGRQFVTESVFDFIEKLIIHIPDKGFHTVRYYGFYANKSNKTIPSFLKLYSLSDLKKLSNRLFWRINLILTYKYDPLLCECGSIMKVHFNSSYFPNYYTGGG